MSESLEQVESVAAEMRQKVLEHLGPLVSPLIDKPWPDLANEIAERIQSLERDEMRRAQYMPGAWLKVGSTVLAMYLVLSPLFEDQRKLIEIMKTVLNATVLNREIEAYLEERFCITPEASTDQAWEAIKTWFIKIGQERFGQNWEYERGIEDHRRYFVNIRRCGFADFFMAHDAREPLYIMCAADYAWGDALEKYGIRLERPTLLAEGSDLCRFQFFKI